MYTDLIIHVHISIHAQIHPAAKLAFHPDLSVGILTIAQTGTRLNTIILISANQNLQNSLKVSPGINFSSTITLSFPFVMEFFPSKSSKMYLLKSLSDTTEFHILYLQGKFGIF
jgi:hypothetical protein